MSVELDQNAVPGMDIGVAVSTPTNLDQPGAIIDPSTLLPFQTPNIADTFGQPPTPPPPAPNPQQDAEAQRRFEYWQSQADKERNERLRLEQELQVARPVMQLVQNDDELYRAVTQRLDGAQPAQPQLKAPVPPERPMSYNETEAYTNPQSESFRFRVAQERYRDERINYLEARNQQALERVQQSEAQRAEQIERARILEQTERIVQTQYGLSAGDARDFVQWSSSDSSVTLPNLVAYYKFVKANGGRIPGAPQSQAPPAPPMRAGMPASPTVDADKLFNEMTFGRKR